MNILKFSTMYFGAVFGAGFFLALIRIPLLVPRFGVRAAELIEMPIMLVVIYFAARWIVHRAAAPPSTATRFGVGLLALALLLITEFTLVLWLQGLTPTQAIANRDPISGTVYTLSLVIFALMPLLVVDKTINPV
jgi:hypothetical protein